MKKNSFLLVFFLITSVVLSQNPEKLMKNILAPYEFETSYTTIDSLEIAYVKAGHGRTTLLFLHGLSSNSDAWAKNIEVLQDHYTCIALDLPGYGKSSKPDANYTPSFFATVAYRFIKKFGLKNVILIGHSMGGQTSIKLAVTYPRAIKKLVLIAPAGLEAFTEAQSAIIKTTFTRDMIKNTTDEQIEKNYQLNFFKLPDDALKMVEDRKQIKFSTDFDAHCEAIVRSISGMLDDTVLSDLRKIKHKTLVIFGDNDMLIPNRYLHPDLTTEKVGKTVLGKIKKVTLKFIKESGHFVQFEKPEEVNLLIQRFVESKL